MHLFFCVPGIDKNEANFVGTNSINDALFFGVLAKNKGSELERNQGLEVIL